MGALRSFGWCVVVAAAFAACSESADTGTGAAPDAGGAGGAGGTGGTGGAVDAQPPAPLDGGDEADTGTIADAGGTTTTDAGGGTTTTDAGGGTPTLTIGEISAVPRTPYGGQSVRLSISLSGQATLFWEQTAGPMGRFSSQSGTTVQWTPPGLNTRTAYTVQVRVGTISPVTKTIAFTVDPPTYTQVWTDILQPNCRSCHTFIGNTPAAGYATLVGANHGSTDACTRSGFAKRIVAGNAQQSLLFRKVAGSQPSACGSRMPTSGATLPIGQIEAIGAWINLGAPNN
jgi:hypothetical protein